MFNHASAIVFSVALAGLASAVALEARGSNTCNSGSVQCCSSVQASSSYFAETLFDAFGLATPAAGSQVGLTCSPITVAGTGHGGTCTQQTVCCEGDNLSGVIVTGCSPVTING